LTATMIFSKGLTFKSYLFEDDVEFHIQNVLKHHLVSEEDL